MSTNPYEEEVLSGSDLFLKIKPNTKVKLRLMTQPSRITKKFPSKGGKPEELKQVWAWGVLDLTGGACSPHIFEGPVSIFKAVQDLYNNEDWGDPSQYDIWIQRQGDGLETRYAVLPGKREPATADMIRVYQEADIKLPAHGSFIDVSSGNVEVPPQPQVAQQQAPATQPAQGEFDPFAD